jgi:hypothetical protein
MKGRCVFRIVFFFAFLAAFSTTICLAQEEEEAPTLPTYSDEDLQALPDDELETICLVRGFELLKDEVDPNTGEVYKLSHDDFVDAAKQCLAIEKEMNDLLEAHPELREELEDEIKAMQEEQAVRRAELESLKRQLLESEADNSNNDSKPEGAAFFTKQQGIGYGGGEASVKISNEDNSQEEKESIIAASDEEEKITTAGDEEDVKGDDELAISEEEPIDEEESEDVSDETATASKIEDEEEPSITTASDAIAQEDTSSNDDLTLSAFVEEFIQYIRKDVQKFQKNFQKYVVPVIAPMFRAGGTAAKYIKAAVLTFQKNYNERGQSRGEEASESHAEEVEA